MSRQKILAVMLPALLVIPAGCNWGGTGGTTSVVGGTPPAQLTIDPGTTILCAGDAASNFADIGESSGDDNVLVKIGLATLKTGFSSSCQDFIGSAVTLIQQKVDPTTYIYVGQPVVPEPQPITITTPIDIANCTSSTTSSDFYLGTPFWIGAADPTGPGYQVFQDSSNFPTTTPGKVASYLDTQYTIHSHAYDDKVIYTWPPHPALKADEYLEMSPQVSITYETGVYEVYSGGQVTEGPAQWFYIKHVAFPTTVYPTLHSGANAKGLCTSA